MKTQLQEQTNKASKGAKCLTKRSKITITILIVIFLVAATSIALLLVQYYEPQAKVKYSARVAMPDGSQLALYTLQLVDRSLFAQNQNITAFLTFSQSSPSRRLQQSTPQSYFLHVLDQEKGINLKATPQSNISMYVKQDTFVDYAIQESLKNNQPNDDAPQLDIKKTGTPDDYFAELNYVFTKAVEETTGDKTLEVKFSNLTMAKVRINLHIGELEFDTDDSKKRMLTEKERKLFLGALFGAVKSIVPKVAGFLVNTVKKYGPIIGKVAGGVIGGVGGLITGGPMGAFTGAMTGMKIGGAIGNAASSFANACIPQGSLSISCTPSSLSSVMGQYGTSSSIAGIFNGLRPSGSGFGMPSFGNFGNLMDRIPIKSLSNFGFGNIFSGLMK